MENCNSMSHFELSLLVTGGAGFIGSNFIKYMLRKYQHIKITNLDKLTYAGNLKNLNEIKNDKRYDFIKGDISNTELINSLLKMKKYNIIINFAAESHVDKSMLNASPFIKTNIIGTLVLLEAIRCSKIDRFIQISTDEVYGSAPDREKFSEENSLNASTPYSASKASADLICNSYFKSYNVPVIITRSSNNYGPYQFPEKLIPLMIKNAVEGSELPVYGNGLNIRDWLYVEDNCEAIDMTIKKGEIGEIYNIGGGSEKTNIEVVKLICKFLADETGKNEKYFEELIKFIDDPRGNAHDFRYALNCNKIKKNLGWIPKTDFYEGLRKTIKWYINNTDWIKSVSSGEYREYYNKVYGKSNK
jgi:dTDP-glucose 4,6-dehydratase